MYVCNNQLLFLMKSNSFDSRRGTDLRIVGEQILNVFLYIFFTKSYFVSYFVLLFY